MKRTVGWVFLLLVVDLSLAHGADSWTRNKGDCDDVLQAWRGAELDRLRECTIRWEMYRNVEALNPAKKSLVHDAFDRLYSAGDQRDAVMALSALRRIGLRPRTLRDEAKIKDVSLKPVVEEEEPAPSAEPDPEGARKSYKRGVKLYKRRKNAAALAEFLNAVEADPVYAPPRYMAARAYMRLRKHQAALDSLLSLREINSQTARDLIERAGKDDEFRRLRKEEGFKALTGVALIQILNGAGAQGKKNVAMFRDTLDRKSVV